MDDLFQNTDDGWLTLKQVTMFTAKSEGFIKSKISRGQLNKYDKSGRLLDNPVQNKGFFRATEVKALFGDSSHIRKDQGYSSQKTKSDFRKNIRPKNITKLCSNDLLQGITELKNHEFDVCIADLACELNDLLNPFKFGEHKNANNKYLAKAFKCIDEMSSLISQNGSLLIHSVPVWLPYYATHLNDRFVFKYWISIHEFDLHVENKFAPVSSGVLFMAKANKGVIINTVREPHSKCIYCGDMLKDYGGKKHLMHEAGAALSDVWKTSLDNRASEEQLNKNYHMPSSLLNRLINLTCSENSSLLLAPYDGEFII